MATFTSTQAGNASAGSTWVGGVAPSTAGGDLIICNHAITIDVNYILGNSPPGAPTAAPSFAATGGSVTSLPTGSYHAAYTDVDASGNESTLSPQTGAVSLTNGSSTPLITLPSLPTGVSSRNIYLTAAGGSTYTLYATGVTGTTYSPTAALWNNNTQSQASAPAPPTGVVTVNTVGSLTVATGVTLTLRGAATLANTTWTMNAGSTLKFDASLSAETTAAFYSVLMGTASSQTSCLFKALGTSGSHVAITSNTSGGNGWFRTDFQNDANYSFSYTDFSNIGTATIDAIQTEMVSNNTITQTFTHCTFTSCGRVNWLGSTPANGGWQIDHCIWTSSLNAASLRVVASAGPASGSVPRNVQFCSFDGQLDAPFGVTGTVVEDCYLGGGMSNTGGSSAWSSFQRNLLRLTAAGASQIAATPVNGDMVDSYVLADNQNGNPHYLSPQQTNQNFTGLIFELTETVLTGQDGGDCIYSGGSKGGTISKCIVLVAPDGSMAGCLLNSNSGDSWIVQHNTCFVGWEGGVSVGDLSTSVNQITQFKDNLSWVPNGFAPQALGPYHIFTHANNPSTMTSDTLTAGGATNNYAWNLEAGFSLKGYNIKCSVAPGTNDIDASGGSGPNFMDLTRNIATWAVMMGSTGSTYTAQKNDALSYIAANPNLIYSSGSSSLIQWVRAGFAPTNPILHNAASDGTDIGAVAFQAAVAEPSGGRGFDGFVVSCDFGAWSYC